jgi:hypothetical protein
MPNRIIPEIPRRSLTDLVALYTYEPSLLDIYVEGSTDKALLEYVLRKDDIHIIEIDLINLPAETLDEFGLTPGNRNRLIALAATLDRELDTSTTGIHCLIDDDFDRFLSRETEDYRYLMRTDFCCLESYWYGQEQLFKYRKVGLHDKGPLGDINLMTVLDPIIREFFLLRATAASLKLKLAWLDPTGLCARLDNHINFDEDEFIVRWLNKNSASEQRQALVDRREQLRHFLDSDTRLCMHGKDFIHLLAWFVRPYVGVSQLAHTEVVARMLACCIDRSEIQSLSLFKRLTRFATTGTESFST